MGIQGLTKLLQENAPACLKEGKLENYFGRKIAIDASMQIYSFMVVVGRVGDQQLTDADGNVTSHLQGMFFRTTRMLEAGLKPIFVFDGKPPQLKSDELAKRTSRKAEASEELERAKESGTVEDVEKLSKRTVRVTRDQTAECKRLLRLMGVPVFEAPGEAEAQCASLAKAGAAFAVATEDMDALTFGAPRLVRNLMTPPSADRPVLEIDLPSALEGLGLTQEQFIDLGILCGCDYTEKIAGIGPSRALALIRKHGNIEAILAQLDSSKFRIPDPFPYKEARDLFINPDVISVAAAPRPGGLAAPRPVARAAPSPDAGGEPGTAAGAGAEAEGAGEAKAEVKAETVPDNPLGPSSGEEKMAEASPTPPEATLPKQTGPDEEGLIAFLVGEKGFNEDRVRGAVRRIIASKSKAAQGRLDSFFSTSTAKVKDGGLKPSNAKRPGRGAAAGKPAPKRGKLGGFGSRKK